MAHRRPRSDEEEYCNEDMFQVTPWTVNNLAGLGKKMRYMVAHFLACYPARTRAVQLRNWV